MTLDTTTTAILIVVSLAANELLRLTLRRWFKKSIDTEYITRADCEACRLACLKERRAKDSDLINMIKGLRDEVARGNRAVESLRTDIIKHMIHSNVPPNVIEGMLDGKIGVGGTI